MSEFYSSYNARHLNASEVAETFISSSSFEELIQNNHSIILGARGCGKTTLMKMLTLPALHSWKGKLAINVREKLGFYAVYISTDIYWNVKNTSYVNQLEKFGGFAERISKFSVTSSIFLSLCTSFKDVIKHEIKETNPELEIELSKKLIEIWSLESTIPQLEYVREAINKRIDKFNQFIQMVMFNFNSEDEIKYEQFDFLNLNYSSSVNLAIDIFERVYGLTDKNKKWALCFDELELAPKWLQEDLFRSLRSTNQKLLYKLSASPILSIKEQEFSASSGNDLSLITMWDVKDNFNLSKKLISNRLRYKYGCATDILDFFGSNEIYNKKSRNSFDCTKKVFSQGEGVVQPPCLLVSVKLSVNKLRF